jgi:hypothetical protein
MNLNDVIYYNNRELGQAVYFNDHFVLVEDDNKNLQLWSRDEALTKQEQLNVEARNVLIHRLRKSKLSTEEYQQLTLLVDKMSK